MDRPRKCKRWNEEERKILREHYSRIGPTALQSLLPGRTVWAILHQGLMLGLSWTPAKYWKGTKFCNGCKKEKPRNTNYFYCVGSRETLSALCKECSAIQDDKNYQADKENRKKRAKELRHRKRYQAIFHYSNGTMKCACCGESHYEFLTFDHINGGGFKHRQEMYANRQGNSLLNWLIKNNFPPGFRILCFNCNAVRSWLGYCPHEREKQNARVASVPELCEETGLRKERDQTGGGDTRGVEFSLC